jgi:hypothetical protein
MPSTGHKGFRVTISLVIAVAVALAALTLTGASGALQAKGILHDVNDPGGKAQLARGILHGVTSPDTQRS